MKILLDFAGREVGRTLGLIMPWHQVMCLDRAPIGYYPRVFQLVDLDRDTETAIYHERTLRQYDESTRKNEIRWRQRSWPSRVLPLPR